MHESLFYCGVGVFWVDALAAGAVGRAVRAPAFGLHRRSQAMTAWVPEKALVTVRVAVRTLAGAGPGRQRAVSESQDAAITDILRADVDESCDRTRWHELRPRKGVGREQPARCVRPGGGKLGSCCCGVKRNSWSSRSTSLVRRSIAVAKKLGTNLFLCGPGPLGVPTQPITLNALIAGQ